MNCEFTILPNNEPAHTIKLERALGEHMTTNQETMVRQEDRLGTFISEQESKIDSGEAYESAYALDRDPEYYPTYGPANCPASNPLQRQPPYPQTNATQRTSENGVHNPAASIVVIILTNPHSKRDIPKTLAAITVEKLTVNPCVPKAHPKYLAATAVQELAVDSTLTSSIAEHLAPRVAPAQVHYPAF
ncbi:hypothetical protein BPAE_0093g00060 [Botrytis paeoniae]|uniref:Uncharacterized protein n=1 Tax=Botrytis paeoniae TaxID=278948 RepID=A0A4Z1FK61_9HELO|nr:hypothetical protein BPAE_0093g00060 [Botrytis paeoniae]